MITNWTAPGCGATVGRITDILSNRVKIPMALLNAASSERTNLIVGTDVENIEEYDIKRMCASTPGNGVPS